MVDHHDQIGPSNGRSAIIKRNIADIFIKTVQTQRKLIKRREGSLKKSYFLNGSAIKWGGGVKALAIWDVFYNLLKKIRLPLSSMGWGVRP